MLDLDKLILSHLLYRANPDLELTGAYAIN